MDIKIRTATLADLDSFRMLWLKFMQQQFDEGALILPTNANLERACRPFISYTSGELEGLVLIVSDGDQDIGVHMDGVLPDALDLSIGRYTMLWGVYLEPAYRGRGISHDVYKVAIDWTHAHGFTGGISGILVKGKMDRVLKKVVDGQHGSSATRPYTVEVCWEFEKPEEGDDAD